MLFATFVGRVKAKFIISVVCALALSTLSARAQTTASSSGPASSQVVLRPSIPAYFPGCDRMPEGTEGKAACSNQQLSQYISNALTYPQAAIEAEVEGVVVVSFVIDPNGAIGGVRLLRDIGYDCGEEAQRVVKAMPTWQPAISGGKRVATQLTVPITFSMRSGAFDYSLALGGLTEGEADRKTITAAVTGNDPVVTNPKGVEMVVTEMVYAFERGAERREFVVRGAKPPEEGAFAKFLGRKPGRLSIQANVVDGLDIRTVSLDVVVVK